MPAVSAILKDQTLTIEISEGETIYNGFESEGHELPHGCLAGSCGTCKVEVTSGKENLLPPKAIEQDTLDSIYNNYPDAKDKHLRLSCRAKIKGDVTFKPFKSINQ